MSETQKHTKPNVPNLRFPEFSGEWVPIKLKDIAEIKTGPFGSTLHAEDYVSDGIPIITTEHFKTGTLPIEKSGLPQVSPTDYLRLKSYRLSINDIVFSRVGSVDINAHVNKEQEGWLFSGRVLRVRPNSSINSNFLHWCLSTEKNRANIARRAVGQTMPSINTEILNETELFISDSHREQDKIANLLTLVDERISIQNKVIERLKSLIKGINNRLMDNPLWDKIYLGNFMQFYSTNSLSWEQLSYENGSMRNLHYGLIHIGLPTMTDCRDNTLPYIQSPFIPKQFTICKDGDIAFADASEDTEEVGKAIELYNTGSMDIVCGLHTIHGRDVTGITVVGFKGFAFNSKFFHEQLRRLAQGSKVYSITVENIKNCYIYIPKVTEQRKIVSLMLCLQEKIKCAERELDIYEIQKQFMLREMLV